MAFRSEPCDFHLPWVYSARVFGGGGPSRGWRGSNPVTLESLPQTVSCASCKFPKCFPVIFIDF